METLITDIVLAIAKWLSDKDALMFFMCNKWLWHHSRCHRYCDWHIDYVVKNTSYYDAVTRLILSHHPSALPKACLHLKFNAKSELFYVDFRRQDMQNLQSIELYTNLYPIVLPPNLQSFTIQRYCADYDIKIHNGVTSLKCDYLFYHRVRDILTNLSRLETFVIESEKYVDIFETKKLKFGNSLRHVTIHQSNMSEVRQLHLRINTLPKELQSLTIGETLHYDYDAENLPNLTRYQNRSSRSKDIQLAFPALQQYIGPYQEDLPQCRFLTDVTFTDIVYYIDVKNKFINLKKIKFRSLMTNLDLALMPALTELIMDYFRGFILNLTSSRLQKLYIKEMTMATIRELPGSLTHLKIESPCEIRIDAWPPDLQELWLTSINDIIALPPKLRSLRFKTTSTRYLRLPSGLQHIDLTGATIAYLYDAHWPNLQHLVLRHVLVSINFSSFLPRDILSIKCYDCDLNPDRYVGFERKITFYQKQSER